MLYRVYPPWMAIDMRKTHSYLKGLAETRARAAGAILRHEQQKTELEALLSQLEADLERYRGMHATVCRRLADSKADLESSDRLILKFDDRLNPEEIEPIRASKGRYGAHGGLREALIGLLKEASPAALSTEQLARIVEINLDLGFASPLERINWVHNSVRGALKKMAGQGRVERLHDLVSGGNMDFGRWRWVDDTAKDLGALRQAADEAGLGVSKAKRRGRPSTKKESTS